MQSLSHRKSSTFNFAVFVWKLLGCWLSYLTLAMIYRLRPLRQLITRMEVVQGKTRFVRKEQPADFLPIPQA